MENTIITGRLHVLELVRCANYFGLDIDLKELVLQAVPIEGIDLLLDIVDIVGCDPSLFR